MSYLSIGLWSCLITLLALLALTGRLLPRSAAPTPPGPVGPPRVGGMAMALGVGLLALCAAVVPVGTSGERAIGVLPALAGALLVFVVGWVDDRRPLPPLAKLLGQIGAASLAFALGLRTTFFDSTVADYLFTTFCLVGGANALNLTDGLDGLAAGIGVIAGGTTFFIARDAGNINAAVLAVALAGASVAFAWLNLPPARVFLGDSGSNLLGFGLAAVAILMSHGGEGFGGFSAGIVMLAVPIAETATTIVRRVATGRSPLIGDLNHMHHRLIRQGWTAGAILALFHGVTLLLAALVLFGRQLSAPPVSRTLTVWLALGSLLLISAIFVATHARFGRSREIDDRRG